MFVFALPSPSAHRLRPARPAQRPLFGLMALLLVAAFFSLLSGPALALGLQVSPVYVVMDKQDRSTTVAVSNTSKTPMSVQVRLYKWTQAENDEFVLHSTNELLISPPIMHLAPNSSQEVRIMRPQLKPEQGEQHYRLFVDELPSPVATPQRGLSLLVRHNMPVFVNAENFPEVKLQWQWEAVGKKTRVRIHNPSNTRAQVGRIWLEQKGQEVEQLSQGLTGYVLPGYTLEREFNIPLSRLQAAGSQLKAQINTHKQDIAIAVAP